MFIWKTTPGQPEGVSVPTPFPPKKNLKIMLKFLTETENCLHTDTLTKCVSVMSNMKKRHKNTYCMCLWSWQLCLTQHQSHPRSLFLGQECGDHLTKFSSHLVHQKSPSYLQPGWRIDLRVIPANIKREAYVLKKFQ